MTERRLALVVGLDAALLAGAVAAVVALAGGGGPRAAAPTAPPPPRSSTASTPAAPGPSCGARSSSARARPARPSCARLARRLRRALPRGRFEPVPGHPGLRNVVGRIPGETPAIAIAAHYDTKRLPGFVGANDGAARHGGRGRAGARAAARRPAGGRARAALRAVRRRGGDRRLPRRSWRRACAARRRTRARHADELRALILLDFVAGKGMRIQREANSDLGLWAQLRRAARAVGAAAAFPDGRRPARSPTTTRRSSPATSRRST